MTLYLRKIKGLSGPERYVGTDSLEKILNYVSNNCETEVYLAEVKLIGRVETAMIPKKVLSHTESNTEAHTSIPVSRKKSPYPDDGEDDV